MKFTLIKVVIGVVVLAVVAGLAVGITFLVRRSSAEEETIQFADDFKIGAASAAYQIEGGWNLSGKTPSVWDTLTHANPSWSADGTNGDVAADSFHMWQKDVDALANIKFEVYRFSISWNRIIPDGSRINMEGIQYYSNLIDALIANNIEPLVTMFHWDLPQYIQDLGGWTNPMVVDYFREYADALFLHFGNRVKRWITINEPREFCYQGYGTGSNAPSVRSNGVGDYLCAQHALLASAAAYRLYKKTYFATQQGQVGVCINAGFTWVGNSSVDNSVAERLMEFEMGKFANPIFSKEGGYPQIMIDIIGNKSVAEGRPWSRLPQMTDAVRAEILGSADFFALNYYTSNLVWDRPDTGNSEVSWWGDTNTDTGVDPSWKHASSPWLYSIPQGLHNLLLRIKNNYGDPIVMITENGWSDGGQLDDTERIEYLKAHLRAISHAIADGVRVVAYTVWCLTDNFEWSRGFIDRFGIHYIDFNSVLKERVPKKSAQFFKDMMPTKSYVMD